MHVVYKIIFKKRIELNTPPYYYIGSCANCNVIDGILYNRLGKIYYGSSKYPDYNKICQTDEPIMEVLAEFDDYDECIEYERYIHISFDVVRNNNYFNLSIASENNFNVLGHSIYINDESKKVVRLKTDDPLIQDGIYRHVKKGIKLTDDVIQNMIEGQKMFKNDIHRYKCYIDKKSKNMKSRWDNGDMKHISERLVEYYSNIENRIDQSNKIKKYYDDHELENNIKNENLVNLRNTKSDIELLEWNNNISKALINSTKFKEYTDRQKIERIGSNNPSATKVFWDGLVFDTLKEFNTYIKENNMNKSKSHDIIKNNPTDTRYIVRRSKNKSNA